MWRGNALDSNSIRKLNYQFKRTTSEFRSKVRRFFLHCAKSIFEKPTRNPDLEAEDSNYCVVNNLFSKPFSSEEISLMNFKHWINNWSVGVFFPHSGIHSWSISTSLNWPWESDFFSSVQHFECAVQMGADVVSF